MQKPHNLQESLIMRNWYQLACELSRLDGEHGVFGKVVQGMDSVFAIEGGAGTYNGKPRKKVVIADSGEIPKSQWDMERWASLVKRQQIIRQVQKIELDLCFIVLNFLCKNAYEISLVNGSKKVPCQ